jgi:NAD+ diphosphatase
VAGIPHRVLFLLSLGRLLLLALGRFGLIVHATILPDVGELETWRHCPRCATSLEREDDGTKVECPRCGFRHYAHSQVTACAVVEDGRGRVLLTRRAGPPYAGAWDLPGGFVGEGEHPFQAVKRELREETGLDVDPDGFVGIWMDTYAEPGEDGPATLNVYVTATSRGGEGEAADDVSELRWAAPDEFPDAEELAFHIADVLHAWRDEHA